jgi:hypothetical protein
MKNGEDPKGKTKLGDAKSYFGDPIEKLCSLMAKLSIDEKLGD